MTHRKKCVLKRVRKGAYECMAFLVLRIPWVSERWDGPRETFRSWNVYAEGSFIERRVLLDRFQTLRQAYEFVQRRLGEDK